MRIRLDRKEIASSKTYGHCRASRTLDALLPSGVATAELLGAGDPALLLAGERKSLGLVQPKRVREFAAGRVCARHAAEQLGFSKTPIDARIDRRPRWPEPLIGSISHTDGFSVAAVGERRQFRAIGIDTEKHGRVSRDLWSYLFLPSETEWLETLPRRVQAELATSMFSAKETFFKCQYEVTSQWLEFTDIKLALAAGDLTTGCFAVSPVGRVELFACGIVTATVHFALAEDFALTAMTIPQTGTV